MAARILAVDDEYPMRVLLSECLRRGGYAVQTAAHGAEALEHLRAQPFDGIVLDWLMPVMDGYGFLQALEQDPHLAAMPVLCLTVLPELPGQRALRGARPCLAKPFGVDALLQAVAELVKGAD